jgi:hypothetical protein
MKIRPLFRTVASAPCCGPLATSVFPGPIPTPGQAAQSVALLWLPHHSETSLGLTQLLSALPKVFQPGTSASACWASPKKLWITSQLSLPLWSKLQPQLFRAPFAMTGRRLTQSCRSHAILGSPSCHLPPLQELLQTSITLLQVRPVAARMLGARSHSLPRK